MTLKQMKIAWILFKVGFKVRIMQPEKRDLYLMMFRNEVDLSEQLKPHEKKTLNKFIDKIEESLEINN